MRRRTEYIVIHCSATPPSMDVDVKDIDRWHRLKGWLKVGYHYVIKRDGTRQVGRKLEEVGAHVAGYNHKSVGVCMVGGMSEDMSHAQPNFTDEQWDVLKATVRELRDLYPEAIVVGHRDLDSKKECPSFDVTGWLNGTVPSNL